MAPHRELELIISDPMSPKVIRTGWFEEVVPDGVNPALPGLYEWRIDGDGRYVYIGKYTYVRRPRREYALNIQRIQLGKSYRKNNPLGFRKIHTYLADALTIDPPPKITLTFLENVRDPRERGARERELIRARREEEKAGGPIVLNGTDRTLGTTSDTLVKRSSTLE
jgi:hypothetical protein